MSWTSGDLAVLAGRECPSWCGIEGHTWDMPDPGVAHRVHRGAAFDPEWGDRGDGVAVEATEVYSDGRFTLGQPRLDLTVTAEDASPAELRQLARALTAVAGLYEQITEPTETVDGGTCPDWCVLGQGHEPTSLDAAGAPVRWHESAEQGTGSVSVLVVAIEGAGGLGPAQLLVSVGDGDGFHLTRQDGRELVEAVCAGVVVLDRLGERA